MSDIVKWPYSDNEWGYSNRLVELAEHFLVPVGAFVWGRGNVQRESGGARMPAAVRRLKLGS